MSNSMDLVIAVFDDECEAGDIVDELHEIYGDGVIENSAIVVKDEEGEFSYEEFEDVNAKRSTCLQAEVDGGCCQGAGGKVKRGCGTIML